MDSYENVTRQYQNSGPLKIRIETHQKFEERRVDLHTECRRLLSLSGDEAILDVGCGPDLFLTFLGSNGHRGRLLGLDLSLTMIHESAASSSKISGLETGWLVGNASDLPFLDGTFDRVAARHMLYHVEDIQRALHEFKRVAGAKGTVLLTTNSRLSLPRISQLENDMLAAFGFPKWQSPSDRFGIENAKDLLRPVFPVVGGTVISNALVFTTHEPIVRYIATMFPSFSLSEDAALWSEMERWLAAEARSRLAQLGGIWRDPKDVGLYCCSMLD